MYYKLLGFRPVSFTNRSSGELIEGLKIFVGDESREDTTGMDTADFFLSVAKASECGFKPQKEDIGSEIDISFNRYGKIDKVLLA